MRRRSCSRISPAGRRSGGPRGRRAAARTRSSGSSAAPARAGPVSRSPSSRGCDPPWSACRRWRRMTDLAGKRAIVTGASSGIGEGIAIALGRAGASVAACGRDPDRTTATREAVAALGVDALALTGDVAAEDDVARMTAAAIERFGGLDVLVNCAGVGELDGWVRVHEHSLGAWERTLGVNVTGPFLMAKAVIPPMLEAAGGAVGPLNPVWAPRVWAGDSG